MYRLNFVSTSRLIVGFLLGLMSLSATAQAVDQQELVARITKSKNELIALEKRIGDQSRSLAQRLERTEQEIKQLRTEAAGQQRIADEQLLGLDKLKNRVEQWTTQSNYQRQLLAHYRDNFRLPAPEASATPERETAEALNQAYAHLEASMQPRFHEQTIITPDGRVVQAQVLALGPVSVALDPQDNTAGYIDPQSVNEQRVLNLLDRSASQEIQQLHQDGQGLFAFDPTLGNALKLRHSEEGILSHLQKGGVWAIPIIFFGFLSLVITAFKGVQLARLPQVDTHLAENLQKTAQENTDPQELKQKLKALVSDTSPAQQKLSQIAFANPVSQQRDDLLVAYLMEHKHILERYMGVVATSAAVAPLLGLLGTVSGMITTFKMMTIFGSGDASTVSGGISEALVTTELGLIVAIPSLLVSALLSRRIKSYAHKLENFAIKLSKIRFKA